MDPLSITTGAVALASVVVKCSIHAKSLVASLSSAPQSLRDVAEQVEIMQTALQVVEATLRQDPDALRRMEIEEVFMTTINGCHATLACIKEEFDMLFGRDDWKARVLGWWKEEDLNKLLGQLDRRREVIGFLIHLLNRRTLQEVKTLLPQDLHRRTLEVARTDTCALVQSYPNLRETILDRLDEETVDTILGDQESTISMREFDFDSEIINTRTYRLALARRLENDYARPKFYHSTSSSEVGGPLRQEIDHGALEDLIDLTSEPELPEPIAGQQGSDHPDLTNLSFGTSIPAIAAGSKARNSVALGPESWISDSKGTPIHSAASEGHLQAVKLLIDQGADIRALDNEGRTPLYNAARDGHLKVVKLLVEYGADFGIGNKHGWTPVNAAAGGGHLETVRFLTENGADIEIANKDGRTPAYVAADDGYIEVVRFLTENGANIGVTDNDGWTPVNAAAENGHLEVVKFLIDSGADIRVAIKNGVTPAFAAASNGHLEVLKLLVERGADLTVTTEYGWTTVNAAARNGYLEVLRLLVDNGVDVRICDKDGWSPVNAAAKNGHLEVVKFLIESGADIGVPNNNGDTPVHSAAHNGHLEVVKLLVERDTSTPRSLVLPATSRGHLEVVKVLMEKGVDIRFGSQDG